MTNFYVSSRAYEDITPWGGQQNMLLQSNSFGTTWTATNATVTQSGTDADPFGGNTAWRLTDNSTNGGHGIFQSITKAGTALRYTFSIHAKAGPTIKRVRILIGDTASINPTTSGSITYDVANGYVCAPFAGSLAPVSHKIEPVPGFAGWFRCSLSVISNTATTLSASVVTDNGSTFATGSASYIGASNYVLIAGAQLEPTARVTGKYTATTTAAAAQVGSFSATVGMIRRPTDPGSDGFALGIAGTAQIGFGAERAYRCTTAGTTAATEPSAANGNPWTQAKSGTVTDNAAVWTEITGQESFQTAGTWVPYMRTTGICGNINGNISGFSSAASAAVGSSGGTGYAVNDVLIVTGAGAPLDYPVVKVTSVSAGVVTGVSILNPGLYNAGTANLATTKVTGAGSGCTITLTFLTNGANPSGLVAGDTIYYGHLHNEGATCQANPSITFTQFPATVNTSGLIASPNILMSVDQSASGHIPLTSADYLAGATIQGQFGTSYTWSGAIEAYGLTIATGQAGSAVNINIGGYGQKFKDCLFYCTSNGNGPLWGSPTSGGGRLENCQFKTLHASGCMLPAGQLYWLNTPNAIILTGGGVSPTQLFVPQSTLSYSYTLIEGVDLTNLGSGNRLATTTTLGTGPIQLVRCKLPSSYSGLILGATPGVYMATIDVVDCDNGTAPIKNERYWTAGSLTTDTAVTRTGGTTSGGVAFGWKIVTNANVSRAWPFESIRSSINNSVTGSAVNVSMYGICALATPTTADMFLEVNYLGASGSTLGSLTNQTPATRLTAGVALTADTSAWDANVTARANTTAYAVGAVIKVASNPGRVFIATTGGTSAGSEPGGYASAVDGGSVTDGGATFIAGYRFKQTISVTPQNAGLIHAMVKFARASSTFWIDPTIELS